MKLTKKTWIIIALITAVVIIGVLWIFKQQNATSPKKSDQYETNLQDETKLKDCVKTKLAEQGYTDGIDCMINHGNPDIPLCSNEERYNAEIGALYDCL